MRCFLNLSLFYVIFLSLSSASLHKPRSQCIVPANNDGTDDTPSILAAFSKCRSHARIVFQNTTYYIDQVMNTTDLVETDIEIHGTLLWSSNLTYWLNNNQFMGFQNGSAAWLLGGTNVTVNGFGYGTLDGNGQAWYDLYGTKPNVVIIHSEDVLVDGVYISSTSNSSQPARNTDGYDTIDSNNITFRNLYVRNGDDAIAIKGNSTNILVEDSTFDKSLGLAFGSLGQYIGTVEVVENITARNIVGKGTRYGAYVKTWTGDVVNYPPNGGGGGTGYLRNITMANFTFTDVENQAFYITQCTSFSGGDRDCDSSLFEISNITIESWSGNIASSYIANMDCSADSGGCHNITIRDVTITNTTTGIEVTNYKCDHVSNTTGFTC
ncbi:glycoside hydrolase family 28 protein [Xylaria cf. heliscus]|nr:glycoside hydrolase family 28 protein [Xylaria cf. heliscus]